MIRTPANRDLTQSELRRLVRDLVLRPDLWTELVRHDPDARIYEQLREEGTRTETLAHIHAPIGLDIGAVTPQEIAVSILAELIAVKHGKAGSRNAAELSMKWMPTKV